MPPNEPDLEAIRKRAEMPDAAIASRGLGESVIVRGALFAALRQDIRHLLEHIATLEQRLEPATYPPGTLPPCPTCGHEQRLEVTHATYCPHCGHREA